MPERWFTGLDPRRSASILLPIAGRIFVNNIRGNLIICLLHCFNFERFFSQPPTTRDAPFAHTPSATRRSSMFLRGVRSDWLAAAFQVGWEMKGWPLFAVYARIVASNTRGRAVERVLPVRRTETVEGG